MLDQVDAWHAAKDRPYLNILYDDNRVQAHLFPATNRCPATPCGALVEPVARGYWQEDRGNVF